MDVDSAGMANRNLVNFQGLIVWHEGISSIFKFEIEF